MAASPDELYMNLIAQPQRVHDASIARPARARRLRDAAVERPEVNEGHNLPTRLNMIPFTDAAVGRTEA